MCGLYAQQTSEYDHLRLEVCELRRFQVEGEEWASKCHDALRTVDELILKQREYQLIIEEQQIELEDCRRNLTLERQNVAELKRLHEEMLHWKMSVETIPQPIDVVIRCADGLGNIWCLLKCV